ncbi:hypothetical protein CALVIDRAFT_568698 [Calocera viscosa TUFC12733]|uniref:Uncharacterized protein n=1 Tax=Calocera viscosa (strain TUFC12733) TaxID=1330018 RepID=A0A167GUI9_CALVF|nr:hypothetical protein CALVIDRAFT_568698 [Calocera viscosa TUFC12733]
MSGDNPLEDLVEVCRICRNLKGILTHKVGVGRNGFCTPLSRGNCLGGIHTALSINGNRMEKTIIDRWGSASPLEMKEFVATCVSRGQMTIRKADTNKMLGGKTDPVAHPSIAVLDDEDEDDVTAPACPLDRDGLGMAEDDNGMADEEDEESHTHEQGRPTESIIEDFTEYYWRRCEGRHQRARLSEELGTTRPFTFWEKGSESNMPDWTWHDWGVKQEERVWDHVNITVLRGAKEDWNPSYKTLVWSLSQTVARQIGSGIIDVSPFLMPSMISYVTHRGGSMADLMALTLRDLPIDQLLLTRESEDNLADLAGNTTMSTAVGSAIMAALYVGFKHVFEDLATG